MSAGPFKCPDCGTWWVGAEHRCRPDQMWINPNSLTIRIWPQSAGQGSISAAPWCGICQGWHVPGMGACTRTYSAS